LSSAQQDWQKSQKELESAEANLKSSEASLKAARTKRDRYQDAAELGALSQDQLSEAQLAVEQQEQAVQAQTATVEAQKKTIAERQQAVQAAVARRQRARAALNPTQSEVAIASEQIAQEKASEKATLATLNKEREALIQQQIELQKKLDRDTRELQQVEIDLSQTTLKATADGIIAKLNLRNPGQTVRSGEEIAQIVPSHSPLVMKASVSPQDIGKLAVGQPVQMRVSACPYPDYGTLKGVVSQISKDTNKSTENREAIATSPTSNQQLAFYEVTIKPTRLVLGKGNNQCAVQLGMEGRADIISREETVLQFLLRRARLIADF
ncbi:MAG: HlyD family secretion protein, partial [Microcystaceae cyanobacterium]